jgi:hypothetical protein
MMLLSSIGLMSAQEETKKDYSALFPQKGNLSFGVDMAQIVRFIGSETYGRINGTGSENAIHNFQSDFFLKYFLTDKVALRVRLDVDIQSNTVRRFVRDDYQYSIDPLSDIETVDAAKYNVGSFEIGIGGEWRKSFWRASAYFGGELFVGYGYDNTSYVYGNDIGTANFYPSTTNFGGNISYNNVSIDRVLSSKSNSVSYGATAFMGMDFFICKNISIGVEFDLSGRATHNGEQKRVHEEWKYEEVYTEEKRDIPTSDNFLLNARPAGFLNLMFYF